MVGARILAFSYADGSNGRATAHGQVRLVGRNGRVALTLRLARSGAVRIVEVIDGGSAKPAGLRVNDVITHYGTTRVEHVPALIAAKGRAAIDTTVSVVREGKSVTIRVPAGRLGIRLENAAQPD